MQSTLGENKYWHLRNHKLFSVLKNSQIEELCIITHYRKAKKNDFIYFADDELKRIFFLKRGRIKIAETNESGNEIVLENYLTHQDMAALICSTRQTVTELLNSFEHEGLLTYGRKEIIIHNIRKLK
jgi:CRP-like cAMP-binding protein